MASFYAIIVLEYTNNCTALKFLTLRQSWTDTTQTQEEMINHFMIRNPIKVMLRSVLSQVAMMLRLPT